MIAPLEIRSRVEDLIYRATLALDRQDFQAYLALCEPQFRYVIGAYSPEIRKQMVWLDHDKGELQVLFENLPKHNSDHALLSRHVTLYTVDVAADGDTARATSALQVFRTGLDGGATELFGVGKIHDRIALGEGTARLAERTVDLQTRMLGIGSHIPF